MTSHMKSAWSMAVVMLLLFGALLLDSVAIAIVAAVLLVAGLVLSSPEERYKGALSAALAVVIAFGLVVFLRVLA